MKRISLFLATNIVVLVIARIILAVLGISGTGQVGSLPVYSAVVGFSNSIVPLLMSKTVAKGSVGAEVITTPRNGEETWLLETVTARAYQWNLRAPEVAIYHSPKPNAFATGASKNNSLIAVSTGLLDHIRRDEVKAVLARKMAHVGSGDTATLTLTQGMVNTFVVFLAHTVSSMIAHSNDGSSSQGTYFSVGMVLQVVSDSLVDIIMVRLSRQREYRADAEVTKLAGASKVIAALQRLKGSPNGLPQEVNVMGITSDTRGSLLSTRPSLDNRIAHSKVF